MSRPPSAPSRSPTQTPPSLFDELSDKLRKDPRLTKKGGPRVDLSLLLFNARDDVRALWDAAEQDVAAAKRDGRTSSWSPPSRRFGRCSAAGPRHDAVEFGLTLLHGARHVAQGAPQRWLFSGPLDGTLFVGSALAAGLVVLVSHTAGIAGDTPLWAWLLFVLGIDVAHVWATLYRVYFDRAELARRPLLYAGAPLVAFGLSVVAHSVSPEFFWRCLAYVAVWHFIRQQVGWMVLYGRRAKDDERTIRFDQLVMWATTLGPVVWWHAHLPRPFWWFKEHDFIGGLPSWVGTVALVVHGVLLVSWLGLQLVRARRGATFPVGKLLLLSATWVTWFGGIVVANDDFAFTVMNVTLHGVPYLAFLWRYAKGRHAESGYGALGVLVRGGVPLFFGALLAFAFVEELLWDNLVWHERATVFGDAGLDFGPALLTLLVPLLSLPQTTHYLLDGFVWKTRSDPSLTTRLGWATKPAEG